VLAADGAKLVEDGADQQTVALIGETTPSALAVTADSPRSGV
jgi:hypothetical protein